MNDIDVFAEMIKDSSQIISENEYGRKKVVLTEPSCSDSIVEIRGLPDDAIMVKADSWPDPRKIFRGDRGECKRSDYVIIATKQGKLVIVYIEMKRSNSATRHEIVKQLTGALCFIEYCRAIGRHFWQKQDFLCNAEHRFVGFGHTGSIRKKKTRVTRRDGTHDQPDRFLKINWPNHVEFNMIVGSL